MNQFEKRVREVVDNVMADHLELHQSDQSGDPSTHTLDDVYELLSKDLNLVKDIKTEVNKIEHRQNPDDQNQDQTPQERKQWWDRFKKWVKEIQDALKDSDSGLGIDWDDVYDKADDLLPFIDNAHDDMREVLSGVVRMLMLTMKLLPIENKIDWFRSEVNRSSNTIISQIERLMQNDSDQSKALSDIGEVCDTTYLKLIECCGNMSESMEAISSVLEGIDGTTADTNNFVRTILDKVNQLQPEATSNNSLEILLKEKAILSRLDEIRGLL